MNTCVRTPVYPFLRRYARPLLLVTALVTLPQCTDRGLLAPVVPDAPIAEDEPAGIGEPSGVIAVVCRASVATASVSCETDRQPGAGMAAATTGRSGGLAGPTGAPAHGSTPTLARALAASASLPQSVIMGGQGDYVLLASDNITVDGGVFAFDVTVQNLIPQALGTVDGVNPAAEGVRVFFQQQPTITNDPGGDGSISIGNADDTETFLGSEQPYYQYDGVLPANATSAARRWEFNFSGNFDFEFKVYVWAPVRFPDGWIDVSTAADTLVADGVARSLTAVVRTAVGTPLPGEAVTWQTSNPDAATVDGSGDFVPLGAGIVAFTATSGPRNGSVTVNLCPNLAVGEVYTAFMPHASALCFAGGALGNAEYTYIPVNLSPSSALGMSVTGTGIVGVTGPPAPNLVAGAALPRSLRGPPAPMADSDLRRDDEAHLRRLDRDTREVAPLIGRPSAWITRAEPEIPEFVITPGVPSIGDLMDLNVASGCTGVRDDRVGRVVSIGQHVIIMADTLNPVGGFTTAQYDSIAAEYDSIAHPVVVNNFGAPTDLDGNGRVIAFYTRAVNELSPPASSAVVAGFFAPRDLFSSAPGSCPLSNEGEMFYMLVPDPTGEVNGNVRTVSSVRGGTVGTMGHELQHLVNASRRVYIHGAGSFEEIWLNEGLSHIVEELMFYSTAPGLAPRQNIDLGMLTSGPFASQRVAAFNRYANQNYGRLRPFLQRPDTTGAFRANDVLATRGATWAFLRYAADRRNGTDADLWFSLLNTTATGRTNLAAVLGVDPELWLRDFAAAMYADDAVTGIGTSYQTTSWNYRSVYSGLGGFPLLARHLSNATQLTLSYAPGGGTSFLRFGVPTNGFAGLSALSGGEPPVSPYALIVVRTK